MEKGVSEQDDSEWKWESGKRARESIDEYRQRFLLLYAFRWAHQCLKLQRCA